MLDRDDAELLARTGRDTPMGDLVRRYWIPVVLADELRAGGPAKRVQLLGERLVAYRTTRGAAGLIGEFCPHRGASLYFGRVEAAGMRCVYHGWQYGMDGQCLDMPNEPADSNFKNKIKLRAYPTREQAGVVWIYMGPPEKQPPPPEYPWCVVPEGYAHVSKWLQRTNYCQGMEGEIDTLNRELQPLRSFVLPGGTPAASFLHLARTVSRRAERLMVALSSRANEPVGEAALRYINRLSDFLFVAARYANDKGKSDVLWVPGQNR